MRSRWLARSLEQRRSTYPSVGALSLQIPQLLLEAGLVGSARKLVCTQPRRMAAITLAACVPTFMRPLPPLKPLPQIQPATCSAIDVYNFCKNVL